MTDAGSGAPPIKKALRRTLRAARAAIPVEARAAAHDAIARHLDARLAAARVVASWAAMPGELDLARFVERFLARGGTVAWPVVEPGGLALATCPPSALVPGFKGILEPPADAPRVETVDAVLVPGLGFDLAGRRLGQGGGYYDGLLRRLRARPAAPPAIGVAYALQVVPRIPTEPYDEPVDELITEAGPVLGPLLIRPAP